VRHPYEDDGPEVIGDEEPLKDDEQQPDPENPYDEDEKSGGFVWE